MALGFALGYVIGNANSLDQESSPTQPISSTADTTIAPINSDAELARLFDQLLSNVQVEGAGSVTRLLADDTKGSQHQRFILQLDSGQTLLITHNTDVAPHLEGLQVGDLVSFYGEYVYSDQGGTIHWTHHDPKGKHVAGWLNWNGQRYS